MTQTSERPTTRTNIVLDTDLVETAMRMTGLRTRRALVPALSRQAAVPG
jgi:Arc/MetJ family transcription regulator